MQYRNNGEHLFILGSARSGTSLMSSIVEASADFATYRAETKLLNSAQAVYGDLKHAGSREKFWNDWYRSRQFFRTGFTREEVEQATDSLRSYIAILGTYMDMVAEKQNHERWVDSTPSNANCIKEISIAFPKAKILHMVRDGRAVALSLAKLGWSGSRTTDFDTALLFSALKWQQAVEEVYATKHYLNDRYLEISYESLIQAPKETLNQVSDFLEIGPLDYSSLNNSELQEKESINSSLHTPNSPFGDMKPGLSSGAVYRWKSMLRNEQVESIEAYVCETLLKLGYSCLTDSHLSFPDAVLLKWRKSSFKLKRELKHRSTLGRYGVSPLEFQQD